MDPEKLREYVRGYDRLHAARLPERRRRAEAALALVPALADRCRERGATAVRLFGSLVSGHWGSKPDIDLAVAGLEFWTYLALWSELRDVAAPIEVDLVDLDSCSRDLRERIARDGADV